MSNTNSTSNITVFSWNEFPVEKNKFFICICTKSNLIDSERKNIDKLLNYVQIIFPENKIIYNDPEDFIKYKTQIENGKTTMILDLRKSTDWIERLYFLNRYLDKGYFIIIGDYDIIPKISLTMSDILIFDTEETTNKYLGERYRSTISNFNIDTHYVLIDKRRMGLNIHGLTKAELDRYC